MTKNGYVSNVVKNFDDKIRTGFSGKTKKVFFVGSHCTGKTTLARITSETYGVPMLPEVARLVLARKELDFDKLRHDPKTVHDYQLSVFREQMMVEKTSDCFVSDRGFDNLAYASEHSSIFQDPSVRDDAMAYLTETAQSSVSDSKIFFVRPNKSLMKDDGVRESLDWEAMCRIDGMVKFMLESFNMDYISINTTNIQERIRIVRSCLG